VCAFATSTRDFDARVRAVFLTSTQRSVDCGEQMSGYTRADARNNFARAHSSTANVKRAARPSSSMVRRANHMKTVKPANDERSAAAHGAESLLERYRRTRDVLLRDKLVDRYRGVVENMARAMVLRLPRSVDVFDLEHAGMWGLLQALDNYEPARNTHFLAFMRLRVRGAMLDELRNLDYLPRLFRRRQRDLEKARVSLRQDLGREPSEGEVAEALGVTVGDLRRDYKACRVGRLGVEGDNPSADDELVSALADEGVESPLEALDRQDMVEKIRGSLQPIEWKVLQLHYIEGMSGKEVARRLRLSASRICQIHGRVMERLKLRLGEL